MLCESLVLPAGHNGGGIARARRNEKAREKGKGARSKLVKKRRSVKVVAAATRIGANWGGAQPRGSEGGGWRGAGEGGSERGGCGERAEWLGEAGCWERWWAVRVLMARKKEANESSFEQGASPSLLLGLWAKLALHAGKHHLGALALAV